MTDSIIIGYLPMPERTLAELNADWQALEAQREALVNSLSLTNATPQQVADYAGIRHQQFDIQDAIVALQQS